MLSSKRLFRVIFGGLGLMMVCWVSADNECPAIREDATAASGWRIWQEDYVYMAGLMDDSGAIRLAFDLDMDAPMPPEVLGWTLPEQYRGKIGLLHYYSGTAGTHIMADITRYAVVNIEEERLLEIIEASAYQSGSRYLEKDDGTYEEVSFRSCSTTKLDWQPGRLVYQDGDRSYALKLFASE